MLNIIISDDDILFRHGLQLLFDALFAESGRRINVISELNHSTAAAADIIVLKLRRGEELICHPELFSRRRSLIIGLTENNNEPQQRTLPLCLEDIIFIHCKEAISLVAKKIMHGWYSLQQKKFSPRPHYCSGCQHRVLSPQQRRVAARLYNGTPVGDIARELSLCQKTIFSHKRLIMNKFNLRTDFELIVLLKLLDERWRDAVVNHG